MMSRALQVFVVLHIVGGIAHAGVVVTVNDTCSEAERAAANAVEPDLFVSHSKAFAPEDLVIRESGGAKLGRPCALETLIHPQNEPEGPSVGETVAAADLSSDQRAAWLTTFYRLFIDSGTIGRAGAFPPYRCAVVTCPLPRSLQGGGGFQIKKGGSGESESAGTYLFLQTKRVPQSADHVGFPFVVLARSEEDWLEVSNRGVVVWKARVSEFQLNQLYFAVLPETTLKAQRGILGVFLNPSPNSQSLLYVPTSAPPPAPAPLNGH